jgi:hypothetical protein
MHCVISYNSKKMYIGMACNTQIQQMLNMVTVSFKIKSTVSSKCKALLTETVR